MNQNNTILDTKIIDLIKHLNGYLKHFPKDEKYALVKEIKSCCYEFLGFEVRCRKMYNNKTAIRDLDIEHEKLRVLLRVAFEMGYFHYKDGHHANTDSEALRKYTFISEQIDALGKIIGNWIKKASQ